jgi:hypothetical protein
MSHYAIEFYEETSCYHVSYGEIGRERYATYEEAGEKILLEVNKELTNLLVQRENIVKQINLKSCSFEDWVDTGII